MRMDTDGFNQHDLRVVTPDVARDGESCLAPGNWSCGGKILSEKNTIEHAGVILGIRGGVACLKGFPATARLCFRAQVIQNYSAVLAIVLYTERGLRIRSAVRRRSIPFYFQRRRSLPAFAKLR